MRNQGWTQDGTLVKDDELYLDGEILKVRDILGKVREPTEVETEQFYYAPPRDPLAEIDKLKVRVEKLEK